MSPPTSPLAVVVHLLIALPALHAGDPVVSNVVPIQRAGTKLVDISFDVLDPDSDQLDISVEVSDDSGNSFTVPVTALSGDTSVNATPDATSHSLTWNAGSDFNQRFNENMVVRVIANDGSAPGPPPPGMVYIPPGSFEMGDETNGTGSGFPDELPVHEVYVSGFYLDKFEVTKALWDEVKTWADANGYAFSNAGSAQGAFHPVHTVNWYNVVKWCNARSEKEGVTPVYYTEAGFTTVYKTGEAAPFPDWDVNGYRLPTEAEWEKAARGGVAGQTYPWGDDIAGGDANYSGSGDPFAGAQTVPTTPVGFYDGGQIPTGPDRGNSYGLYDMAGNIWEWCWDGYDSDYYSSSPEMDPRGPAAASGARVLRGGSWLNYATFLRCAKRGNFFPVVEFDSIGFRSARGL